MSKPQKKEDVLLGLTSAVEGENLRPTFHALERMKERNIFLSDVYEAIYRTSREEYKDEFNAQTGDWKYAI